MDDIIYKYFPVQRITYFQDELLRITQPGDLNDPYECLPVPPSIDDVIKSMNRIIEAQIVSYKGKKKEIYRKELVKEFQKEINNIRKNTSDNLTAQYMSKGINGLNNYLGIISFSQRWNSSLMWAHYTNSHKGFCIGFNAKHHFFQDYLLQYEESRIFHPVHYSNDRIKVPVGENEEIDVKLLLTKSTDWEYENEVRLIVPLRETEKKISSNPFNIHLVKIPHDLIEEIIIGASTDEKITQTLKKFCNEKSIPLYLSKISETKFDMEKTII
jgi:hypothetical protein